MALSIKTAEADALARRLARLTGETMTEAVTTALRERLAREQERREATESLPTRLDAVCSRLRTAYDSRQARRALRARIRFGRGMGHGGSLNFGDAFSYALAPPKARNPRRAAGLPPLRRGRRGW